MKILFSVFFFFSIFSKAQITKTELGEIANGFYAEYNTELRLENQIIVINPAPNENMKDLWWNLEDVRASYAGFHDKEAGLFFHYLYMFGGYARLNGMTYDGVVATLCHELGHGIGGAPYKLYDNEETISVEGQSDYFAFRSCLPRMFKRLPAKTSVKPVNAYTDQQCKKLPTTSYDFCTRAFQTLESERLFFRLNLEDPNTEYDKHDPSVSTSINQDPYFYPSSQCRLDTMMNGILGLERPRCWFVP